MQPVEIAKDAHWVGVNDRTTDLFEGLWPIDDGVTYNAYLINDDQTALIDPVRISKVELLLEKIEAVTDLSSIEYIILNHMEQDHTGSLNVLKRLLPEVTFVGTEKTQGMLESFYGISDNVRVVGDGEILSLGATQLKFFATPFIHWPETMMTYDEERGVLFSGDGFGMFGALQGGLFDDEVPDMEFYQSEGIRYFANVVAKYSRPVLKVIEQLSDLEIDTVAPAHGLVWRDNPSKILSLYEKWAGYGNGPAEPEITMIYGSMYGFTERMMNAVAQGANETGVPVNIFDAGRMHPSYVMASVWQSEGVIVAAPTYEGELFPPVDRVLRAAVTKMVKNRKMALVGSYGWRGGAFREVEELVEPMDWETVGKLDFTGKPTMNQRAQGRELGQTLAREVRCGGE